jgi:hypothetical protein
MTHSDTGNVFVVYLDEEEDDDEHTNDDATFQPSFAPTPVPPERDAVFLKCPPLSIIDENYGVSDLSVNQGTNNTAPELWGVAPVEFVYSIQLNALSHNDDEDLVLTGEGEDALMISLSKAMMYSIYQNECGDVDIGYDDGENHVNRELVYHQRKRRLGETGLSSTQKRRQLNIQSIALGTGHKIMGKCPEQMDEESTFGGPEGNSSDTTGPTNITAFDYAVPSCGQVSGIVVVGFDTMGVTASSFYTVGTTVIDRIQDDIANGRYLDQVNRDMEAFNIRLSRMAYINSRYFEKVNQGVFSPLKSGNWTQSQYQLSTFSKITIPIIVLLFLLMLCFCWCSYSEYAGMLRQRFIVVIYGDGHYDDSDEYSDGKSYRETYRKPKVVETLHHVEAQPNRLSYKSSCLAVGNCNRPNCNRCRHLTNPHAVTMIGELSKDFSGDEESICLPTTSQDLTVIQRKKLEEEQDISPSKTSSTTPNGSRNPFSLSGTRSPSFVRIVGEESHNNDGVYNDPEIASFVKVDTILAELENQKRITKRKVKESPSTSTSPWGSLPSLLDQGAKNTDDTSFTGCDPLGLTLLEIDSDERSDDYLDFKSVPVPRSSIMYTYAPSTSSKREASHAACPVPTSCMAPFTTKHKKKNYNNKNTKANASSGQLRGQHHIVLRNYDWVAAYDKNTVAGKSSTHRIAKPKRLRTRRQKSLEELPRISVVRKRTLTDDRGRVRQEVAL